MALSVGTTLNQYEITGTLGAGGMGEVYRARDTKLGREVAIKVLPDELASARDRSERFEREAKLLASLNHPAIATLYGFEDGYLVMELVEGETLAERIARGPLPAEEARELFAQIAEGLEAAHEKGIVHRDLKPANIKITPDGGVKILDFGLAKALAPEPDPSAEASQSPTLTKGTALGAIMGTASYMSPEQARGKDVDKRTDIWAFGCCLYESLTGEKAFGGETVTDILANVVHKEPSWATLDADATRGFERLLRRCLSKKRSERLRDIGDARLELLEGPSTISPTIETSAATLSSRRWWIAAGVFLVLGAVLGSFLVEAEPEAPTTYSSLAVAPAETVSDPGGLADVGSADALHYSGLSRNAIALSPDGRTLVFTGVSEGVSRLWARPLGSPAARPLKGTEGAVNPFFSPSGEWVGYWASGKLEKVALSGGQPAPICEVAAPVFGAAWSSRGIIAYAEIEGGLWQVPEDGGVPSPLTELDETRGETSHRLPHFLPDGRAVLFSIRRNVFRSPAEIAVQSLETDERSILVEEGEDARFATSGHVLFARRGELWAVPIDSEALVPNGPAVPVLPGIVHAVGLATIVNDTGAAQYDISLSGDLAVVAGGVLHSLESNLVWINQDGKRNATGLAPAEYFHPRISPRGDLAIVEDVRSGRLLLFDTESGVTTPLPGTSAVSGAWSPDGSRIAFAMAEAGPLQSFIHNIEGSAPPEPVTDDDAMNVVGAWTPDGNELLLVGRSAGTGWNIRRVEIAGNRRAYEAPETILGGPHDETHPALSPDGRWLAYASNESGRFEVYVRAYPGLENRRQVSKEGGSMPRWSRTGNELYFIAETDSPRTLMTVERASSDENRWGAPRALLEGRFWFSQAFSTYDVAPDGRFLFTEVVTPEPPAPIAHLDLVLNWTQELERLAPLED